ncbi:hypothetical protein [Gemmiger formicilis]|uniref:hypothetical protein n=1 Tax=Gemmiger formicilis TaxID=745368 RepID=UPI003CCAE099
MVLFIGTMLCSNSSEATPHNSRLAAQAPLRRLRHGICVAKMLDNVGLRYPHRASGAKAPRTLRPLPLLRFAVSATGGAHLCSIQYYLRFWLSSCRTSLAVSALRIMQYCPWFFIQTGKRFVPRALTSLFRRELSLNFKRTNRKIRILLPCLAFGIRIFVILLISCTGHVISVQKSL